MISHKHSSLSHKNWDVITLFNVAHLYHLNIIIFLHNPCAHWCPNLEWVYMMGSCSPSLTPFPLAMDNSKAKSNGVLSVFKNQFMCLCRSFQELCMVAALCTQIICASGTNAAVTKVQCLCDVSCCLVTDLKILQGSFSQTDVRTLIKFRMLLGKSALVLHVEGTVRDICSFIWNCLLMGKCH